MSDAFQNEVKVITGTQRIVVPPSGEATVVLAGPPGPPGVSGGAMALTQHVNSETPHPAYDDMQSLTLLFENGLI
jgi:hypothetical protein